MFLNESGTLGIVIEAMEQNTGSLFVTLLGFVIVLLFICLLFRIPLIFSIIFVLPVVIGCMAYFSEFIATGGVMLIYLGIMLGKQFFFND